jgi:hypothetical protein
MPYIEMNENIFDQGIFSSFTDLKAYYEKISTSDIDDENQAITVIAYLKNEENNSIIISETIGVVLDYSGDDVLINFN